MHQKIISPIKIENISKPNQSETGGLASISQIRLNARLKLIVNVD